MKYLKICVFLCLGLSSVINAETSVDAKELKKREMILPMMPVEPDGYSWKVYYGIGVLCPKNWSFVYPTDSVQGSCINPKDSKVKISAELYTVIGDGQTATQLTGQFMKEITDNKNNTVDIFNPLNDSRVVLRYKTQSENAITHKYFIANNSSKRLHILSITTNEESWDSAWQVAETTFKQVALLPMWESL